jgi:acid phosphatase type 7
MKSYLLPLLSALVLAVSPGHAQRFVPPPPEPQSTTVSAPKPPVPLPPPSLPVALYLTWQRDPATTMTVHWHTEWTAGFSDSVLEYRPAASSFAPWVRASGRVQPMPFTNRMVHTVELTGLAGDTAYQFRFGRLVSVEAQGATSFEPHGPVHTFRTLPATLSRPVKFLSGGDLYGTDNLPLLGFMCRAGAALDPDFAIVGGDIAYVNNEPKAHPRWFDFFRVWGETMRAPDGRIIPIVPAIGNHEVNGDTYEIRGGEPRRGMSADRALFFYTLFSFPGRPGYNVLDFGDYLSLVALDSYHTSPVPGPQTDWLRATLAQRRSVPFVVPFYHVPAYPSVRSFNTPTSITIRANWVPAFDEAGIRFAFENHDHAYKVTHPLRAGKIDPAGTRYLGDGAWAVNTRVVLERDKAKFVDRSFSRNHVFEVTLHPGRADFRAVDPNGEIFDTFTINATPRP